MGCTDCKGGTVKRKRQDFTGYEHVKEVSANPFHGIALYRDDWRHTYITFNGSQVGTGNCCRAKAGDDGFVEMYVFMAGSIVMEGNQPKTRRINGSVTVQALTGYQACKLCVAAAKKGAWWAQ